MSCTLGKQHVCCTRIENLCVKAGNEIILDNVNLHLHCGELTAIIGRNGAGKTTFLKALLNEIPHSGKIIFEGEKCADCKDDFKSLTHDIKCPSHHKKHYVTTKPRFGYVPQKLAVEAGSPVSVEDFILAATSSRPIWLSHRKKDKQKVKEILSIANAQDLTDHRVSDLSGGEIQRVMLSLALSPMPDILLLDEPVSGVDRNGLKSFYQLVSALRRDYDITILLITHDLDIAAQYADRVVLIDRGIAAQGSVEEVYNNPKFTETFGHIVIEKNESQIEESEGEE